jgi:S-ribosylhomocysteine lyase
MEKIASFTVDHDVLEIGMYISRIDDDIVTYDLRMVKPNQDTFLDNDSLHTIEHLFATFARNSELNKKVIYVGPMGCRTGFYLIMRDCLNVDAINLVKNSFEFVKNYEGDIPGNTKKECGNYLEHNLEKAKRDVVPLLNKLQNYTEEMLKY